MLCVEGALQYFHFDSMAATHFWLITDYNFLNQFYQYSIRNNLKADISV